MNELKEIREKLHRKAKKSEIIKIVNTVSYAEEKEVLEKTIELCLIHNIECLKLINELSESKEKMKRAVWFVLTN